MENVRDGVGRSVGRSGGGDNETARFIAGDFLEKSIYGDSWYPPLPVHTRGASREMAIPTDYQSNRMFVVKGLSQIVLSFFDCFSRGVLVIKLRSIER